MHALHERPLLRVFVLRNHIEDNAEKINYLKEVKGKGLLRRKDGHRMVIQTLLTYIRELPRPIKNHHAVSPLPLTSFGTLVC